MALFVKKRNIYILLVCPACYASRMPILPLQLLHAALRQQPPLRGGSLRHLHPHCGQLHPLHANIDARVDAGHRGHHHGVGGRPLGMHV